MSENMFNFSLVSPEKVLFSADVKMVTVPGSEGEFGFLPDHAPLLSSLKEGVVTVVTEANEEEHIFVAGGFADMNDNICTILAEDAQLVSEMNKFDLEQEKIALNEKLNMIADGEDSVEDKTQVLSQLELIDKKLSFVA